MACSKIVVRTMGEIRFSSFPFCLKNIILIARNPHLKATDIGVSPGQFNFIRGKYRSLNVDAVKYKIKFLADFDLKLKTSQLDLDKRDMLNYIINNLNFKITL